MNDERNESAESRLKHLLRQARPEPELSPRFEESVWRRIERLEAAAPEPGPGAWLERLVAGILRPRLAIAGMVAVLLIGGVLGAMDGAANARESARDRYVASVAPAPVR